MDKPKILSGDVIVAKGVTKKSINLPEVGLKDVVPDGSWLELKQIQTALDSRKHILDVERIEKLGTVSHATWRDDLQLAEVTQKAGGCWQYFGYNVGKTLYLRPEEVLFLMEVNSLLLKHNDVTVSLQKAYSLVLNGNISYNQYRVYASLSRLGYKVFRHKVPEIKKDKSSHGQSESLDKHLKETLVENILEQPLADSLVEVLDNKTNVLQSNFLEQLPITETNKSTDKDNIKDDENKTIEERDSENNKPSNKTKDIKEFPCVMEIEETESGKSNMSENKQQVKHIGNESTNLVTENNVDANDTSVQTNTAVKSETEKTINNSESDKVMEVDDVIPMPSNNESQEELAVTAPLVREQQIDIIENTDTPHVKAHDEDSNVNKQNESTAMDMSDDCCQAAADSTVQSNESDESENIHTALPIEVDSADSDKVLDLGPPQDLKLTNDNTKTEISDNNKSSICFSNALINNSNQMFQNYVTKLKRLTSRQCKPSDFKTLNKHFENVPDLFRKQVVTINVPEQEYIPKNIFVNNSCYVLDIKQIRSKCNKSTSVDSSAYNSSDEVNGNHVRRLRNISTTDNLQNVPFGNHTRLPARPNLFYRPYHFWRPQNNLNYVQFNMFFQRPSFSNVYFHSRLQYQPRPNPLLRSFSYNNPNNITLTSNNQNANNNPRKRMRSAKATHLQSIKSLAVRLKQLIMDGDNHIQNIESLHRLLYAYNTRYKTRLRLTKDFEVINDETIVETIDLADDGETRNKRPRLSQDSDKFDENLNLLRQLALKLKDLEAEDKATSKHKRALSKAIKTFNKSYDADIYINSNFEVIDRRFINIDSDSESDCVITKPRKVYKGKKLRNPFNILKRRSEQQGEPNAGTSKETINKENDINNFESTEGTTYSQNLSKIFNENWLPRENDFGRAEVVHKNVMNSLFMDVITEQYLLNFVKSHFEEFNNWLEAKIAFQQHIEESDVAYQNQHKQQMMAIKEAITQSELKPLLDPGDCLDTASVLEKLRIVKNNKEIPTETTLTIDFDVYRREIMNFKKTNPPKPHFRLICLDESSMFPSSADIVSILSKCDDKIQLVFAIVGVSSVSYLQLRPIDIPVYVASNDSD